MAKKKLTEKEELQKREAKAILDSIAQKKKKKELYEAKEWYTIRALLGNQWANWFIMAGARER